MAFTVGPERRVNTTMQGNQDDPAIASLAGGGYVVAWSDVGNDFETAGARVRTQRFDAAGNPIGSEIETAASNPAFRVEIVASDPAVVGLTGGEFVVGYVLHQTVNFPASWSIHHVLYSASGEEISRFANLYAPAFYVFRDPALAPLGSNFIIVWAEEPFPSPTSHDRILGQDFAGGGARVTIADPPPGIPVRDPDVAQLANGNWVSVWDPGGLSVPRANVFTPENISISGEFFVDIAAQVGPSTPRVTGLTGGNFVVAWSTWSEHTWSFDIRARLFDPNGNALGPEFLVNANTAGDQKLPDLAALPDGGFIAVWQDNSSGNWDIHFRTFSGSGTPTSDDLVVNTTLAGNQTDPSVAVLSNGDVAVAWTDDSQTSGDTSGTAVVDAILSSRNPLEHGELIQSRATGQLTFLDVENADLMASHLTAESYWPVVAEGDFDQNGTWDFVTQKDGLIDFVFMSGGLVTGSFLAGGTYWDAKGAGPFAALPGHSPSIVTQDASGQINLLQFDDGTLVGSLLLPGTYWDIVGVGDFNGDSSADIVTQRDGHIDLLFFDSQANLASSLELDGAYWPVMGIGDYNHDGHPDLVTQDPASGEINHLTFTGATLTGSLLETTAVPGWDVVHALNTADQFWGIF